MLIRKIPVRSATRLAVTIVVASALSLNAGSSFSDDAATEETSMEKIVPIAIEPSYLEGRGLVAADPSESDPSDSNVSSDEPIENSSHIFHTGKIMVAVYEAAPGKVHIEDAKYDEFVQILEGRLILTPDGGSESYEYKKGDSFVVPKGYTGTWHMPEKYRELIVIDTSYLESE
jgi:uncharacterized cupin superfamily protein